MSATLSWTGLGTSNSEGRETADPLGFRAAGVRIARDLVPGITQRTWMVRGFSLLCLGLDISHKKLEADRHTRFERFERFWVGAQSLHHGDATPFAGKRAAAAYLALPRYPLAHGPILSQQVSTGIWGTYRTACAYFELVKSIGGRRSGPQHTKLTARGSSLAKAALQSAFDPGFNVGDWSQRPSLDRNDLGRVPANGQVASKAELSILSEAVNAVDQHDGAPLMGLHECWSVNQPLTLEDLAGHLPKSASAEQRAALDAAVAIERLAATLEKGYRLWVTGGDSEPLTRQLCASRDWQTVRPYSPDLDHLHAELRSGKDPTYEQVHAHQLWLSRTRGSRHWEPATDAVTVQTRRSYEPYDFALNAAGSLFNEGLFAP